MPYPLARFRAYACEPFFSLQMHRTMPQTRSALLNWLYAFVPQSMNTHPREWLRAGLGWSLAGWLLWGLAHLAFMPAMENRLSLLVKWMWNIAVGERASLLITGRPDQHMNVEVGLERVEAAAAASPEPQPGAAAAEATG